MITDYNGFKVEVRYEMGMFHAYVNDLYEASFYTESDALAHARNEIDAEQDPYPDPPKRTAWDHFQQR